MLNLSLWVFSVFFVYFGLIMFYYFFGKSGLFCYGGVATIISNIVILRYIDVLGFNLTLSSIIFMSTLSTINLITEKYGRQEALRAITLTTLIHITFSILISFTLRFNANNFDIVDIHLKFLFGNNSYIVLILVGTYILFASGTCSALIYSYIRGHKVNYLFIPHNVSRIVALGISQIVFLGFINQIFLFFTNENIINFTEGSLIFNLGLVIFDSFLFYFINKLKIHEV